MAEWLNPNTIPTYLLAFFTFAAVLVALFGDPIRHRLMRPKLTISIEKRHPDCHKVKAGVKSKVGKEILVDYYYFRLRIGNDGKTSARNVEVFAESLKLSQQNGALETVNWFLPMNLLWAYFNELDFDKALYLPSIAPKMWRHCGFGHIVDPDEREKVPGEDDILGVPHLKDVPKDKKALFSLDIMFRSNTLFYLIPPGLYRLTVVAAAENAKPVRKTIELNLPGTWYSDEATMLAKGIGLRVLEPRRGQRPGSKEEK